MRIKILSIFFLSLLALSGCASASGEDSEAVFTISDEREASYDALIENTLNSFYWRYNSDTIIYEESTVPEDEEILQCSNQSGYNMSKDSGRDCVRATAELLYFNRESAGTVYFYFIGNDISGLYYTTHDASTPCSLYVRNAYLTASPFSNIETGDDEAEFTVKSVPKVNAEGIFDSITIDGITYSIFNEGSRLVINRSNGQTPIYSYKNIDLSSENLVPISAAFINNTTETAVLFGTETYPDGGSVPVTVPQKIVIFDSDFNATETEIISEDSDDYSVGYDNGCLLVARGRSIDYYPISGTEVSPKQVSYYIGKSIIGMEITDLDNDGVTEYIFTDGMDIFIYHKTLSVFKCIWSTHLSIESFEKYIYTGDLNRDGIKEIYVFDSTGTSSKYIIGEKGLYTQNENIDYGQRYHVTDFNGDGMSDCFIISGADINTQEMRVISG